MPIIRRLDFNNLRMFKQICSKSVCIYLFVKARRTMSFISLSCKKKKKIIFPRKKSDKIANLFSIYKNFILKVNINE